MLPAPRSLYFKIRQDKYKTRHLTTDQFKKSLREESGLGDEHRNNVLNA